MKLATLCLALACACPVLAGADEARDRIAAERTAAGARLAAQERECETRFIVSPCVEDVRTEHRAVLARLRQEQLQIDEAHRHAAAAARRKATAERVEAQQARASEAPPEAPRVRVRRAPEPAAALRPGEAALPRPMAGSAAAGVGRAEIEQLNEAKFEARARAAQAHRDEVARRSAQRAAQGKVAAPLPPASGAPAAR